MEANPRPHPFPQKKNKKEDKRNGVTTGSTNSPSRPTDISPRKSQAMTATDLCMITKGNALPY